MCGRASSRSKWRRGGYNAALIAEPVGPQGVTLWTSAQRSSTGPALSPCRRTRGTYDPRRRRLRRTRPGPRTTDHRDHSACTSPGMGRSAVPDGRLVVVGRTSPGTRPCSAGEPPSSRTTPGRCTWLARSGRPRWGLLVWKLRTGDGCEDQPPVREAQREVSSLISRVFADACVPSKPTTEATSTPP